MTSTQAKGARGQALVGDAKFHGMRVVGQTASRASRTMRSLRPTELAPGRFTVLTVNWNTVEYLRTVLDAVARFSPPGTEVVVADNASKDGSREFLRTAGVNWFGLPINLGHGPAMDMATTRVQTEYFVTLDVDAFPITADWLDVLRGHLEAGNEVVGGRLYRSFAHPSMMAMRTQRFRERKHTFIRSAWRTSDDFVHGESWDVGELISRREAPKVALIEASEVRGPGVIGTVYGGLVYHNGVSAHGRAENREEGRTAWREATERFLAEK
jgi:glycosyltransferase involved in cell wall biosynthesis